MKRQVKVMSVIAAGGLLLQSALVGCGQSEPPAPLSRTVAAPSLLLPESMRIHPTFTRIIDGIAPGTTRGIEAELEFSDSQQEPIKAEGRVFFELFEYRKDAPDPRGRRVYNPWVGPLATEAEQKARWNRTTRTYTFHLSAFDIRTDKYYVLTATFEPVAGKRLFNRLIIVPIDKPKVKSTTNPLPFSQ